jgi:hypothetical protein
MAGCAQSRIDVHHDRRAMARTAAPRATARGAEARVRRATCWHAPVGRCSSAGRLALVAMSGRSRFREGVC